MILKNDLKDLDTKALIFDVDGTLTRWTSVPDFLKDTLASFNVEYTSDVIKDFFTAVRYYESYLLISGLSSQDAYAQALEIAIEALRKNNISGQEFRDAMFLREASYTTCETGIETELDYLSQKYLLCCYTNWFASQAHKKLAIHGIDKYFPVFYSFENVYLKYSSVGFKVILSSLEMAPDNVIHIGDSQSDLACKGAKIPFILIDYDNNSQALYSQSDAVITEFKDIRRVLKK